SSWMVRHVRRPGSRIALATGLAVLYFAFLAFNRNHWMAGPTSTRLTLGDALLGAPFQVWAAASIVGFLVAMLFAIVRLVAKAVTAIGRKLFAADAPALESPDRRQFLQRTAALTVSAPFVAGSYGLLWGRLN